jgi:hypothetical protein
MYGKGWERRWGGAVNVAVPMARKWYGRRKRERPVI